MDVDVDKYKFYSQTEFKVQKENMEYFFRMEGIFSLAMSIQEWTFGPLIYQEFSYSLCYRLSPESNSFSFGDSFLILILIGSFFH